MDNRAESAFSHPIGISEKAVEAECDYSGYRVLERVGRQGLWQYCGEDGKFLWEKEDRVLGEKGIIKIAREEIARIEEKSAEEKIKLLPKTDSLQLSVKERTNRFISQAVKSGWLPKEAVKVVGRFTRGSDIAVVEPVNKLCRAQCLYGKGVNRRFESHCKQCCRHILSADISNQYSKLAIGKGKELIKVAANFICHKN